MRIKHFLAELLLATLTPGLASAQVAPHRDPDSSGSSTPNPWSFSLTAAGYVVPHAEFYVSPTASVDREWLHLEARYNYENQQTSSVWFGYNFGVGHKLVLEATPMIGGVFGDTTGVAPGYQVSMSYKRMELSSSGEYVFDTKNKNGSFFYSWPQLTYALVDWFRVGLVAQRTRAYHTKFDIQRGLLVGFSRKKVEFTTYIFNPGWSDPTLVFEVRWSF
ncbi:MAG TPA: hypothetical protein VMI32_12595 [Candidatus Solibacter sp.]|nr:hypothetical protein [Candidatus Solibacter sp.]